MIINRDVLIGILFALLLAALVGGFNYWKRYQEKRMDELASLIYLYERGKLSKEDLERKLKGTPLYPYFLIISGDDPSKAIPYVDDEQLGSLLRERKAYTLYKEKNYTDALNSLESIDKEKFNYPSALLLKAFTLQAKGDVKGAKEIYNQLSKDYKDTYFGRIAYGFLLSLKD